MLFDLVTTDTDWIQTVIRVILGVIFFAHGAQKLLGWFGGQGLDASLRSMREHLGIPAPLALIAIAAEFFGGIALVVGLFSRIAAVGIGIIMLFAIALAWPLRTLPQLVRRSEGPWIRVPPSGHRVGGGGNRQGLRRNLARSPSLCLDGRLKISRGDQT